MRLNNSPFLPLLLLLGSLFSSKIKAETISSYNYFFEGFLSGQDPFASGSFSGRFSYLYPQELNLEYANWSNGVPVSGRGLLSAFEIKIGTQIWNSENVQFSLQNGPGLNFWDGEWWGGNEDSFSFNVGDFSLNNDRNIYFHFSFLDENGALFSDVSLPNRPMLLNNFTSATLAINWSYWPHGYPPDYETYGAAADSQYKETSGSITSLVPEPSSLSLLLAGGAVLMVGRRLRRD